MPSTQLRTDNQIARNNNIDSLRGFATFLVVLGHTIQYSINDFDSNIWFRLIYSFHMPLFMFICGYVSSISALGKSSNFKTKTFSLLIPFISWAIVKFILHYFSVERINITEASQFFLTILRYPDNGLWFLWILFLINCINEILKIYSIKPEIGLFAAWLIFNLIFLRCPDLGFGLGLLRFHLLNFVLGVLCFNIKERIPAVYKSLFLVCSSILFFLIGGFWYRTTPPSFILMYDLGDLEIKFFWLIYQYLSGILGIGLSICLIKMFHKALPRINECLRRIGLLTLEIYAVHFYILGVIVGELNRQASPPEIALIFLTVFLATLGLIYLIKSVKVLNMILFGKLPRRNSKINL